MTRALKTSFPARAVALAAALLLAACASAPEHPSLPADQALQQADVPASLPGAAGAAGDAITAEWDQVVREPRLRRWVKLALAHNRDLRVAVLNVQRAQAQLGLADAARLPVLGVGLNASRAPNSQGNEANNLTAGLQLSTWEIDLFGRLASLSAAAQAQLAASLGVNAADYTLAELGALAADKLSD